MKKILLTTLAILISLSIFGRSREKTENPAVVDARITSAILELYEDMGYTILPEIIVQDTLNRSKMSNYEKYWEEREREKFGDTIKHHKSKENKPEFDDLYYQPEKKGKWFFEKKDVTKKDTIQVNTIMEDPIVINNYYYDDEYYYANLINRYHHGSFGFWFDFYYSPFYYNSWYWGYNPYWYDWYYPYYGYNYWYSPYPYYGYNYWYPSYGYSTYRTPNYGHGILGSRYYGYYPSRHETQIYNPSSYSSKNFNSGVRRTSPSTMNRSGSLSTQSRTSNITQQQDRRISATQNTVRTNPQNKAPYSENRRTYAPTYQQPHMSTRPQYNNTNTQRSRTTEMNMQQNRISQPSTGTRTQTRTYSTPSQRSSNSYSTPSRNSYSAPSQSRSYNSGSSYSTPSRSYNGGSSGSSYSGGSSGVSRSSGGSSGSSSSSHSSGGRR